MSSSSTPKKRSLAKRLFLGYGKVFYKLGKGTVRVFKSPTTRRVMEGIARSTDNMVTDRQYQPKSGTQNKTKVRSEVSKSSNGGRDIHIHIHLDKNEVDDEE